MRFPFSPVLRGEGDGGELMKTPTSFHPNLLAPSISALPCTRGRGVGREGAWSAQECRVPRGILTPSPLPLSPEYRGEGTAQQIAPSISPLPCTRGRGVGGEGP